MSSESTCSKIQYDHYLISVACSWTELSNSERFWRSGKGSFTEKAKIVDGRSVGSTPESTYFKLHYDPYLIPVACSQTELCQYEPYIFSVACSQTKLSFSEKILGEQVKGRSPKKLKLLIADPYVAHLIAQVLSFNMNLISSPQRDPRPNYSFGECLGDEENCRSPKKLKSLIEVPYVAHLKLQVLNFNMNLIFSPQRVHRPSYPFPGKFGRSGKGSFTEKANIIDKGSQCSTLESTGCKLESEPCLFSVECSQTKLYISANIWENR